MTKYKGIKRIVGLTACLFSLLIFLFSCVPYNSVLPTETGDQESLPVWTQAELPTETQHQIGLTADRGKSLVIASDCLFEGWRAPINGYYALTLPLNLIYQSLLTYDTATKHYIACFADAFYVSDGKVHITVNGQRKWHDDMPASLADVIYSLEYYQRLHLDPLLADMTLGVQDETDLVITFPEQTPDEKISYLLSRLYILPRHVFTQLELQATNGDLSSLIDQRLIGSGPYRLLTNDEFVVQLQRVTDDELFPEYIDLPRYDDLATRQRAISLGLADLLYGRQVAADGVSSFAGDEALYSIFLNAGRSSLQKIEIRLALSHAYRQIIVSARLDVADKRPFMNYQYFGSNELMASLDAERFSETLPHFSPGEVVSKMSAANVERNEQGFYKLTENDKPLELIYLNDFLYTPMLEQFIEEVAVRGFSISLVAVEEAEYLRRKNDRDFDLLFDVYRTDDRDSAIEERIKIILSLLGDQQADLEDRLEVHMLALYSDNEDARREALHVLTEELQDLVVVLPLNVAPYAYLNIHKGIWQGDLQAAVGTPANADPFGYNWHAIFKALSAIP